MMKDTLLLLVFLIVASILLVPLGRADDALIEDIVKIEPTEILQPRPSTIHARITLPFHQLTARAETTTPRSFEEKGNGPKKCARVFGKRICVGTRYEYTVVRGPIILSRGDGNGLRASVQLEISGKGGFRGTGADLLDLDAKRFRAKLEAFATIGLALEPNWCPKTAVKTGFRWIEPARVEIVGGVWIDISKQVEKPLRDQLRAMGGQISSAITCEDVRREARKFWSTYSFPLQIPNADPLYVNIEPKGLGFSGLEATPEAMTFLLTLKVMMHVAGEPIGATFSPLPDLQRVTAQADSLSLVVLVRIAYDHLEKIASAQILHRPFAAETLIGTVITTARDLRISSAEERLAVGSRLTVTLPPPLPEVKGWVQLAATPTVTEEGRAIVLEYLSVSRKLDDENWNAIVSVLEETLKPKLESASTIDLNEPLKRAEGALTKALAQPLDGIVLDLGLPQIRLGRILPAPDELLVELLVQSDAKMTLLPQH